MNKPLIQVVEPWVKSGYWGQTTLGEENPDKTLSEPKIRAIFESGPPALNRTILELKLRKKLKYDFIVAALNRTILELKY